MVYIANLKQKANAVLMFSPIDEKTPYEQGEDRTGHAVQSVAARLIVHKFPKRSPAWTSPDRVLMDLL